METGIYAAIGVIVAGLMAYLANQAKQNASPSATGKFHLRLHKAYAIIGWGCVLLGVGFFIGSMFSSEEHVLEIAFVLLLFLGGLGAICVLWYNNHSVTFDSNKLSSFSWLGKRQEIKWKAITSIKFNAVSGMLVFSNDRQEKVKAHMHLVGLGSLVVAIESHTKWKKSDLEIP